MSAVVADRVYLGLGSNLQKPEQQLQAAIDRLQADPRVQPIAASSFYRTAPWGKPDQPEFVNAVVALNCKLAPLELLRFLLAIENSMGRVRGVSRWAPRIIDIDLLCFGQRSISTAQLQLPHPHMHERAFVLVPLLEVASDLADARHSIWAEQLSKIPHADVVRLATENRSQIPD